MAARVRLDIGSTIDTSFNVVRRNPRATLLPVTAVSLVSAVVVYGSLVGIVVLLLGGAGASDLFLGSGQDPFAQSSTTPFGTVEDPFANVDVGSGGEIGALVGLSLLLVVGSSYLFAVSYASVSRQVGSLMAGEEADGFGAAVRAAAGAGLRSLPVWLAVFAVLYLGLVALIVVIAIVAAALPVAGAIFVGFLLLVAAAAAVVYLAVRLCLFPAVFALEGLGFASLGRSWRLTAGNAGPMALVLMVAVLLYLAVSVGASFVTFPFQVLGSTNETLALVLTLVIVLPITILGSVIGLVALAAPLAIAYLRLRAGAEGDDLARAAAAFSTGASPTAPPAPAPTATPSWDFAGGAADGSWVSRHSPPGDPGSSGAGDAARHGDADHDRAAGRAGDDSAEDGGTADEDAERRRFGR